MIMSEVSIIGNANWDMGEIWRKVERRRRRRRGGGGEEGGEEEENGVQKEENKKEEEENGGKEKTIEWNNLLTSMSLHE